MAEPKQKSVEFGPSLTRILPAWVTPMWTEAPRWRSVVRNQPIAIICRDKLITYAQALPWDIRARKTDEQDALEDDINYYKNFVLRDFDEIIDLLWQDALDLPIGGNAELLRWPAGALPAIEEDGETYKVTRPNPKGHVFKIIPIDGATLTPTYDPDFPMMQRVMGNYTNPVFFAKTEIGRILLTPRPEFKLKGYGMPPPQRIFLAISMLYRGDQYYANLLLDTPEAGILDLIDMQQEAAEEWVSSYKSALQGIDPQKIGVLYEHENPAVWIPFGRPPAEMSYNETTLKYARLTAAGYWLTLTNIGLEPGGDTLAGSIRQQREVRMTGFGLVKEKTTNFFNNDVLPPYLEFVFIEKDDEALSNTGRARLLNSQALKAMVEAGLIDPDEGQQQLVKDGLLTVELKPPSERKKEQPQLPPPPPQNGNQSNGTGQQTEEEMNRLPPSQGGRGDVGQTQRATLGDPAISATPPGSARYDQLSTVFRLGFNDVLARMGDVQLRRLVRAVLKVQTPVVSKALVRLSEADIEQWASERIKGWFGEKSAFDEIELIQKADAETLKRLEELLDKDRWWELPDDILPGIVEVLKLAFSEGATIAAELVQRFLYEEGLTNSPDVIGLNFELKNPATLAEINESAAQLVRRVNDGTKHYLKSIIAAGVDEGISSQDIAQRIQEGEDFGRIIKESNLVEKVVTAARREVEGLTDKRITSIVNTEINRAETDGRVKQWQKIGLTKKQWTHSGSDIPCSVCQGNIDMGLVDIDYMYPNVFGEGQTYGPPGHPGVCHCAIFFDEKELIKKAGKLNVWNGA